VSAPLEQRSPLEHERWSHERRAKEDRLLGELAVLPADDPARQGIRDELVLMHLPLVRHLVRRYRDRGESEEDLMQVGTVGLINAIDRFDVDRGLAFSTFATPTILGEIKRHFRDRTWSLRVPRRMQELHAAVSAATETLSQSLGRAPTVRELAESLSIGEDDVLDALEVRHAYSASSLDAALADDAPGGSSLAETLGADDEALSAIEDREALRPLLAALPDRERRIVTLRFLHNRTQSQIAQELGISQMHVSRLLARSLGELRLGMAA
jgi:RNA polymerase sigma-B factor